MAELRARSVSKRFGERAALDGASLAAQPGQIVALLGASGSGKSTLLRIMLGLVEPDEGSAQRPERTTLVQQRPGLLRASVLENARLGLLARGVRDEAPARVALARVGLAGRERAHAWTLSGGEAQRLALARALVTRPPAMLLDEATNQLDPEATLLAEGILREERARGCAIVLVTHQPAQARRLADRVAFLDGGRVVEEGEARAVLAAPRAERLRAFLALS